MFRLLRRLLLGRRPPTDPDRLIDAVIADIRRKLVEARLQMLAADLARKELAGSAQPDPAYEASRRGIEKLEATLHELRSRRNLLIARARDADARLAIERALMEVDAEPAQVALDLLAERVTERESEAEAVAEVRQISSDTWGESNG